MKMHTLHDLDLLRRRTPPGETTRLADELYLAREYIERCILPLEVGEPIDLEGLQAAARRALGL